MPRQRRVDASKLWIPSLGKKEEKKKCDKKKKKAETKIHGAHDLKREHVGHVTFYMEQWVRPLLGWQKTYISGKCLLWCFWRRTLAEKGAWRIVPPREHLIHCPRLFQYAFPHLSRTRIGFGWASDLLYRPEKA